jgi:hypothetical protein
VEQSASQTVQLSATDADNDTLTYSKTAGEAWGTVNSSSGLITFNLTGVAQGNYTFTFQVSDGTDTDSESFDVSVVAAVPAPMFGVVA